jgi:hypothetical protein
MAAHSRHKVGLKDSCKETQQNAEDGEWRHIDDLRFSP